MHLRILCILLDVRKTISIIDQVQSVKMIMEWKEWAYLLGQLSPLVMVILLTSKYGDTGSGSFLRLAVLLLASFRMFYVLHPETGCFSYWCNWCFYFFRYPLSVPLCCMGNGKYLSRWWCYYHNIMHTIFFTTLCIFWFLEMWLMCVIIVYSSVKTL